MEKTLLTLKLAPAAWCDRAAAMLASSIRGAPCYRVGDLRAEVLEGRATLVSVTSDAGELVGYVVLRVERYQGGAEGVIVAAAGKLAGAKLYGHVVPALERLFLGVSSFRIESCRRGAARELEALGYLPTHVVWRKIAPRPELAGDDRLEALHAAGGEACLRPTWRDRAPDVRGRPGKLHGGGGGSSSSASTQTTNNVDRRLVTDAGSVGVSGDSSSVTINTLDAGAISGAIELIRASDQETTKRLNDVLGVASSVFDKAAGQVDRGASLVATAYDQAKGAGDEKTILIGVAIAAVALVAITVIRK
jgi:hypothetical protein